MLKSVLGKSNFARSVLTLLTGGVFAQAIPLILSPVLTRLYSPDEFGAYALYAAIVSVLVIVATGQYESAVLLPKKERHAFSLVVLAGMLVAGFSVAVLVVVVCLGGFISDALGGHLGRLIYLLPISVFVAGLISVLSYWNTRKVNYKSLSKSAVLSSTLNGSLSVGMGYASLSIFGLVLAQLSGLLASAGVLFKGVREHLRLFKVRKRSLLFVAKRYRKFAQVSIPHGLFSSLSNNLPALILASHFSPAVAGFYFLAFRVAATPLTVIGNSIYQVFFQQLSIAERKRAFYNAKFFRINALLIPLFIFGWFLLPTLFRLLFGLEWAQAGEYTQILLPLLYMKFISNIFSSAVYIYFERQLENFIFGVIINLLVAFSLLYGAMQSDVELALKMMVATNSFVILVKLIRCQRILEQG